MESSEIHVDQTDDELLDLFGDESLAQAAKKGKLTTDNLNEEEDELAGLGLDDGFFSGIRTTASPSHERRRRVRRQIEKATRVAQRQPKKKKRKNKKK